MGVEIPVRLRSGQASVARLPRDDKWGEDGLRGAKALICERVPPLRSGRQKGRAEFARRW